MRTLHPVSKLEVERHLFLELGGSYLTDETIRCNVVLAEYLRGTLFELSQAEGEEPKFRPVYIRRLTNAVRYHLEAVWPHLWQHTDYLPSGADRTKQETPDIDPVRWVLENCLAVLGEAVHVGNGYWLPTPLRLVRLPYRGGIAIIGGIATSHMRRLLPEVQIAGYGRLLPAADIPVMIQDKAQWWQDYRSWVGWVPENLSHWTETEVAKVGTEGSKSSPTFVDFEVYNSIKSIPYRTRSWIPAQMLLAAGDADGVLLCRSGKPFRYFLGEFALGQLVRERTVSREMVRWLQLGLCLLGGVTPLAVWEGTNLGLVPPLPYPLRRHLTIYSYPFVTTRQTWYHVPSRYRSEVEQFLTQFGYRIVNKGASGA